MKFSILLIFLAVAAAVSPESFHAAALAGNVQGQPAASDPILLPTSPFQPDLTPGYVLIEGDIQIPLHQYREMLNPTQAEATYGGVTYWVGNNLPFDFVTSRGGQ